MATVTKSRGVMHFISRYTGKVVRHLCKVKKKKPKTLNSQQNAYIKVLKVQQLKLIVALKRQQTFFLIMKQNC